MEGNKQLSSKRRCSKKRTFHGNKHTNISIQQTTLQEESDGVISESSNDINTSKSASASKIDLSFMMYVPIVPRKQKLLILMYKRHQQHPILTFNLCIYLLIQNCLIYFH